jgi:hypothetical protein
LLQKPVSQWPSTSQAHAVAARDVAAHAHARLRFALRAQGGDAVVQAGAHAQAASPVIAACTVVLHASGARSAEPRASGAGRGVRTARGRARCRVARGEQLLAVEDRVGAGGEAQRLQFVAHRFAAGRQSAPSNAA